MTYPDLTSKQLAEIDALITDDKIVGAVKMVREHNPALGLREAVQWMQKRRFTLKTNESL